MADPVPVDQLAAQVANALPSSSTHGHGYGNAPATPTEKIPKIQWDDNICKPLSTLMDHNRHMLFAKLSNNSKAIQKLLCKKYNIANETLSSTGAGLTAMELRENLEMKSLPDKILDTFPCTANPGQDFAMEAQQFFSEGKYCDHGTATIIGDGWALGNEDAAAEEDEELECDAEDRHGNNVLPSPSPKMPNLHLSMYPLVPPLVLVPQWHASGLRMLDLKYLQIQIQNSTEAKSETKQLKIQAQVIRKELKAHDKSAQHEYDLKLKIAENEHQLSMASKKTKQMELELRLEETRIAQLEAGRHAAAVKEGN
ncbi:hypothetical protein EDC04DRAFT_2910594 [Pisolithus marmoratus]|nr:hypothetical protein EDC04DRAFT_2910594 [Pisolithus marmoratus]